MHARLWGVKISVAPSYACLQSELWADGHRCSVRKVSLERMAICKSHTPRKVPREVLLRF